jgi:hypothetical protein
VLNFPPFLPLIQSLYHRFRTFLKFLFVVLTSFSIFELGVIFFGPKPVAAISTFFKHTIVFFLWIYASVRCISELSQGEDLDHTADRLIQSLHDHLPRIAVFVDCFLVFWIAIIIASIETAIVWNHISGANAFDSGQWLALIAATAGFVRVLYIVQRLVRWSIKQYVIPSFPPLSCTSLFHTVKRLTRILKAAWQCLWRADLFK